MKKNPYTITREVLGWVGTLLATLLFLGIVGAALFGFWLSSGGWGPFLLNALIVIGIFGAFCGLIALLSWLGGVVKEWWVDREEAYKNKQIRDAHDAGTPLLDPEPLLWGGNWGTRMSYRMGDAQNSYIDFKPREFYEQDEEKYREAELLRIKKTEEKYK